MGAPDTDVLVVGAGPVGLMLAGDLAAAGVRVTVLERLTEPTTESRASVLHARTVELLDERGLLEYFGPLPDAGPGHFGGIRLDLTEAGDSNHAGQWKVPQTRVEAVLARRALAHGAGIRRGHTVTALRQEPDGVRVLATTPGSAPRRLSARYVVGCDGEDSTVRRLGGFRFPGTAPTKWLLRADLADIELRDRRFERHPRGVANARRGAGGITRIMVHSFDRVSAPPGQADFAQVRDEWAQVTGEDIGAARPLWVNAFHNARRQAACYRQGRVLLAGDAAHVQLPVGGQALNLGLQDAMDLGARLAAHLAGRADAASLDGYDTARRPAGARTLSNIEAQAQLLFGGPDVDAARALFRELLALASVRRHLGAMISGLDRGKPVGPPPGRTTGPAPALPHTTDRRITMGKLTGKTALVTGSSRGIGRATALRLGREGALVAVHCSGGLEAAEGTVSAIEKEGGRAFPIRAELGVPGDVHELFLALEAELKERTGTTTLDILVNNAGVMGGVDPEELTPEQFDRLFAVNAKAPYFLVQRALANIPDGGRIINISSGLTRMANPQEVAYAMTKGAIDQLTLHFAKHLGPRGITVNSVGPGITDNGSALFDDPGAVAAMGRYSVFNRVGESRDIADVVAFLAGDDSRWITGSYLDASGGTLLGG
ncbi:SDR family oxidoreductase [Streptomyces harbinensis]|uniref:SDR family NAD(P)-dependent oxidoreductase n=1 Tax=Streptomyces harbinensis TaxID=1176198 RepID=UPI00159215DF|nr:SDR family oxidoreductase [Streptomyces harbinensis]QKV71650.1 SDR family oxidoreductase [Streptomyces harbinensis]